MLFMTCRKGIAPKGRSYKQGRAALRDLFRRSAPGRDWRFPRIGRARVRSYESRQRKRRRAHSEIPMQEKRPTGGGPLTLITTASGAPGEIRTPDPQVRSLVLYPTELRAREKRNCAESVPNPSIRSRLLPSRRSKRIAPKSFLQRRRERPGALRRARKPEVGANAQALAETRGEAGCLRAIGSHPAERLGAKRQGRKSRSRNQRSWRRLRVRRDVCEPSARIPPNALARSDKAGNPEVGASEAGGD